jgi:hypothetical protein
MMVKNMGSGDQGSEHRGNGMRLGCRHFLAVDDETGIFCRNSTTVYYKRVLRDLLANWVAATGDDNGYDCRRGSEQGLESEYICTKAETAERGEAKIGVLKPAKTEELTPAAPIIKTDTLEREP